MGTSAPTKGRGVLYTGVRCARPQAATWGRPYGMVAGVTGRAAKGRPYEREPGRADDIRSCKHRNGRRGQAPALLSVPAGGQRPMRCNVRRGRCPHRPSRWAVQRTNGASRPTPPVRGKCRAQRDKRGRDRRALHKTYGRVGG